ncbi:Fasciclin-like arabinogalactan protein 1 [Dichanthelium oligosanthes]|uniref:Fasciclin-like arabinogalactan protein 1 n=1 Tax=Dichanthelium oligosanthes TaxID=888268 RepID=A0A1E5VZ45_9POAL|nr:Fasciclin-like arabinogalactan protein 1 [Dichanthelium oligosanthes]
MRLAGIFSASTVLLLLLLGASPSCHGATPSHNITDILAAHPNFTEFSAALSSTGAGAEIDRHTPITVLAIDNGVMAQLKAQKLQPKDLEHVIYLHALLDYFDATKLGSIQGGFAHATSLYQAVGKAQGGEGIVNITVFPGGRVAFALSGPSNALPAAFYQQSVKELPNDIAVLQVSAPIWSPAPVAAAPAPPPDTAPRLADLLSKNGCGGFSGLLAATADAATTFERSAGGVAGLTVFCPGDKAVADFNSTFKHLSADGQVALLLYHGVAAHYSAQSLKAINGDVSTLATDGSKGSKYNLTVRADGDTVKLSSASPTAAKVTKTVVDKALLAVYLIDAVLLPRELFNGSTTHTPAPASSPAQAPPPAPASSPASPPVPASSPPHAPTPALAPVVAPATPPTPRRRPAPSPEDTPADSPDADSQTPADQKNNGARDTATWSLATAVAAAVPVVVLLL